MERGPGVSAAPPLAVDVAAPASPRSERAQLAALSLAALGVVYGDIGTSPLYAIKECFSPHHGVAATPENVLGVLSLVLWSLLVVIVVKYLTFIMRRDNRGEGGILALLALLAPGAGRTPRAHLARALRRGAPLRRRRHHARHLRPERHRGLEVATPHLATTSCPSPC
jgi:K+ transporter